MDLPQRIAHFLTHRRGLILTVTGLGVGLAALAIGFFLRFDSDILKLLPGRFASVQGLKILDTDFTQARELTFVLADDQQTGRLEEFADAFAAALRREPWVVRVMERPPTEEAAAGVEQVAVPLLLNLPPPDFANALTLLEPAKMEARLAHFREEIEAGSPRAEMQLGFDPLGLVVEAMKPLASSFSFEQAEPLVAPDGTTRLVLALTNQPALGVQACRETMQRVAEFKQRVLADWDGPAPQIMVTGRTPYVEEMSSGMHVDILSTLGGSILLVAVVFYAGFRRFAPLLAMAHVLLLCCLAAVALGGLIFGDLNLITIGLCSILVGLGIDFGMILYGLYAAARQRGADHEASIAEALRGNGGGVTFGALTTSTAFLVLWRSDCVGFAQLGVLIAIGILCAAGLMMTLFFVFLGSKHAPRAPRLGGDPILQLVAQRPLAMAGLGAAVLLAISAAVLALPGRLEIDANPRSLEPRNSQAGGALRRITEKLPAAAMEPVVVVLRAANAAEFAEASGKLQAHLAAQRAAGKIGNFSTPAAFALAPARLAANAGALHAVRFAEVRANLSRILDAQGLNPDGFASAFTLLDALERVATGPGTPSASWHDWLPAHSPWWFVLERFFADTPGLGAAYVTPLEKVRTAAQQDAIRAVIEVPGLPMLLSGWSYTLADLGTWARSKAAELSLWMIGFNTLLLVALFRRVWPVFVLLTALALSIGALLGTLAIFHLPLNLFNVLAFPLVLGVGVDYAIYIALAVPHRDRLPTVLRPVLLSAVCTVVGFGSLALAHNPSLRGLGLVCAIGVAWCLFATLTVVLPLLVWRRSR